MHIQPNSPCIFNSQVFLNIQKNDTTRYFEDFGVKSISGNDIILKDCFVNNWITIKIKSKLKYSSKDIINGFGEFVIQYIDSIKIFASPDSIFSL